VVRGCGNHARAGAGVAKSLKQDGSDTTPVVERSTVPPRTWTIYSTCAKFDVAVTQGDVFDYFRNQRKISNLESRVNYIARLPVS
jgi:hypothetical protein